MDDVLDLAIREWMKCAEKVGLGAKTTAFLTQTENKETLTSLFCERIQFGTAGLRAKMGVGFALMNQVTVSQTTQGIVSYIKKQPTYQSLVVIGYDGRHNSRDYALRTAGIFLTNGFKVAMFLGHTGGKVVPTPFVAFTVRQMGAQCGVMITASHNTKEYNGYKLYWSNGAQITSPIDVEIQEEIMKNLEVMPVDVDVLANVQDVYEGILNAYKRKLKSLCRYPQINRSSDIGFVYTALHGVGYNVIKEAFPVFELFGPIAVLEQTTPDPDFPTVQFPNPEEGKGAFEISFRVAKSCGEAASVVLANDPDADRFSVAVRATDGSWIILNGNEIAALFAWWTWLNYPAFKEQGKPYMVRSAVSSSFIDTMGSVEGFNVCETLTGFKWIANKVDELLKDGNKVLFAFEEAIGFMVGCNVLDKDGISAACVFAEMINYLKHINGMSVLDKLDDLYSKYGIHICSNSYYLSNDPKRTDQMFDRL
ncbi:hypothetical protein ACOME3_009571 [Neoechinorhynchus agilis]